VPLQSIKICDSVAMMNLTILYEDNHIIVVDKAAGILSQKDSSGVPSLLDCVKDYIKKKYNKSGNVFLGLVHRLDKPVSGIMVFARTSKAAQRLGMEFAGRHVVKMYIALIERRKPLVQGKWVERKDTLIRKRGYSELAGESGRGSKSATMKYLVISSNDAYSLILINIMTGRKHQIRTQLAAMDMPIVGDVKYGSSHVLTDNSICLHSIYLNFEHPTKKIPVEVFSTIPDRMSKKIKIDDALWQTIKHTIRMQANRLKSQ
jgi:23S rRNA pseudouridine1911/1915/1917 synthase